MKKLLAIFSILSISTVAFAYSYNANLPVPGKTITSQELQSDSLFSVYSFALRAASPDCKDFSIINTSVSKPKKDGIWEENWTVKACTNNIIIPITFTDKDGTTSYEINPMGVKKESK